MKYSIKLHMADVYLAGLDGDVSMFMRGSQGTTNGYFLYAPDEVNNFEDNDTHIVVVSLPDLGELETIRIKVSESGPSPDGIIEYVEVTNEEGLTWGAYNPDPTGPGSNGPGWVKQQGWEYKWSFVQIDPEAHTEAQIARNRKANQKILDRSQKDAEERDAAARKKSDDEIASLQRQLDNANSDKKRDQILKDIDKVNKERKIAGKGMLPAVELTIMGDNIWYATDAEDSESSDGPHPGTAVAGENYLAYSNGNYPTTAGLSRPVLAWQNGVIRPAVQEVSKLTEAAKTGNPTAINILQTLKLPLPPKQRNIFDLFGGP